MSSSSRKRKKSNKPGSAQPVEAAALSSVPQKTHSILGWITLLGPILIVLFVLLFGSQIPYLKEQSAVEAEDAAETVCLGADADLKAGDYQNAYGKFMYALQIKPDLVEAHLKLGRIYYLNKDISGAISWLQKAIALDPPQKDLILNNLGLLYAQQGEYVAALKMFEQALATGLNAEQIYNNIGNVKLSLGLHDEAIEAFKASIDARPTLRTLYLEMLRKVLIDFKDEADLLEIYQAAKAALESGVTDRELEAFDARILISYGRSPQREIELQTNLLKVMGARRENADP